MIQRMLACLDVHYRGDQATAACVSFEQWRSDVPAAEHIRVFSGVAPYEPGHFYRRELPCLLGVLADLPEPPEVVIVDGYVWLDANGKPGLGAHLFHALGTHTPVIGVAKSAFHGATAIPLRRGTSGAPLFVTSAGIPPDVAAAHIAEMSGAHRIPTLLKRADRLCRG